MTPAARCALIHLLARGATGIGGVVHARTSGPSNRVTRMLADHLAGRCAHGHPAPSVRVAPSPTGRKAGSHPLPAWRGTFLTRSARTMRPDLPVTDEERHLENVAAHFVIELADPHCADELRDECIEWLKNPQHRSVFEAVKRAWDASVIIARREYRARHKH